MGRLEYKAKLEWDGNVGSEARVREFAFFIDTNTDGNNRGPNPTEMLLSAIGGCLMVNWGRLIKKMRLDVKALNVEVRGWRGLEEPQLKEITYKITITTGEDEKKILRVKELSERVLRDGTED
ncbi:OsmC family protein [Thermococcus celer]|uniref:Osmotically inducible protein OsmC n=1 Tax=Thermococcus celer Vu 13 = JCM 8558 TaxID=1293037 RepID=A0A218P0Q6_THECE|nr:OsmC family protein [Thermococcus celer]ASI98479.1 osmotically inducible protein OsmC [Thermococcus celer Vu 13 = JCM 8558]